MQQQLLVMTILQQREWSDIAKRTGLTGKTQVIDSLRGIVALLQ